MRRTRNTLGASVHSSNYEVWGKHQQKQGGIIVKKTIVTLACALIGPLAFAQTNTTSTEKTTTTQPTTTQTTTTYTLGTAARIVNGAGQVVTSALTPNQRVRVYYTGTGETRVVERVVVED